MKLRTKQFAITIGHLTTSHEKNDINRNYGNQTIRLSSSVAANYRAVRRQKSKADFLNKSTIVEEELNENILVIKLLEAFNQLKKEVIQKLSKNSDEFLPIIIATLNTTINK